MFVLCVTTTISAVHFKTLIKTPQERKWREMEIKSPEGEGEGGFLGQTIYLDRQILVDIASIQIIAFASAFSLFAPSILINQHILFF